MISTKENIMKKHTLDALGSQIISNEVAIISMLQALTQAQPAIGKALVQAMRENCSRVPGSFYGVRERVEQYLELLENRLPAQAASPPRRSRRAKYCADSTKVLRQPVD
jgi:hypothetical protein